MAAVDFKDLVLDGSEKQHAVQKKEKNAPIFEIVANSGADFAVRRTVGKSSRLLVMLVSQGQYYVKNERSGEISDLDYKTLTSFLSGCSNLHIGCLWLDDLQNQKQNRTILMDIIRREGFKETASSGLWKLDFHAEISRWGSEASRFDGLSQTVLKNNALTRALSKICKQANAPQREMLKKSIAALSIIESIYSLDEARVFAQRLADVMPCSFVDEAVVRDLLQMRKVRKGIHVYQRNLRFDRTYFYRNNGVVGQNATDGDFVNFKFSSLMDYVFEQSAREGFAGQMNEWLVCWKDTLLMQIAIYGEVIDKYPENLLSLHHMLTAQTIKIQEELTEEEWSVAVARLMKYDWNPEGESLIITHPHKPDDIYEEARMQSNCVASYIDSVISGRTLILFCRRKEEQAQSHLTIEVSGEVPTLRQVKARFNREATDEDMRFLEKWCQAYGIEYGRYERRFAALSA